MIKVNNLTIEMTNRCNLKCDYCFAESNHSECQLSVDEIKKAIDIINPEKTVSFSGGEPLVRYNDVIELINYVAEKGKIVRVETNGTIPINWDDFLVNDEKYDIRFNTSIDGFKEICDKQRGDGVFEKALNTLKEAKDNGYITFVKATLPDEILLNDLEYMREFASFLRQNGATEIRFGNIRNSGRGKKNVDESYRENLRVMQKNINQIADEIEKDFAEYQSVDGNRYLTPALCMDCRSQSTNLTLDVNGILRLVCPFQKITLCHYSRYTQELHKLGMFMLEKYKFGYQYDVVKYEGNVFKYKGIAPWA